jgi:hypothetical protein
MNNEVSPVLISKNVLIACEAVTVDPRQPLRHVIGKGPAQVCG